MSPISMFPQRTIFSLRHRSVPTQEFALCPYLPVIRSTTIVMDCEANDEGCNAWEEEGGRSNMQINTVYK